MRTLRPTVREAFSSPRRTAWSTVVLWTPARRATSPAWRSFEGATDGATASGTTRDFGIAPTDSPRRRARAIGRAAVGRAGKLYGRWRSAHRGRPMGMVVVAL